MGGEDEQAGVGERAEQHQDVAVVALAADLVGVHPRGLVAVVAVGDQQLGVGERHLELARPGPRRRSARACWTCRRGRSAEANGSVAADLLHRPAAAPLGVGEQAEDGGQVGPSRARELEPVLLRPRVGALVRADPARAVLVHPHAREHARAGAARRRRGPGIPDAGPRRRAHRSRTSTPRWRQSAIVAAAWVVAVAAGRSRRRCRDCAPPAGPAARRRSRHTEARSPSSSEPTAEGS